MDQVVRSLLTREFYLAWESLLEVGILLGGQGLFKAALGMPLDSANLLG